MRIFSACIVAAVILTSCGERITSNDSLYVWADSIGNGRADYVMFRNAFSAGEDATGEICLFADSRYHLYVNGQFAGFGPARFYPENPRFDRHDISDLLVEGKNVIAVKALSNGTNTYQVPLSQAGFIAWGSITIPGGRDIELNTPGNWVCRRMEGYDRTAPKMSFATGAMEAYDARKDPWEWKDAGFEASGWYSPVPLSNQDHWGSLEERTIPHLTNDKRSARLLGAWSLQDDETRYSFRVKSGDRTREDFGRNKYAFAYTYIYSPEKQTIKAGLWWGEHWLNGKGPLPNLGVKEGKPNRSDILLELDEGWNFFFIKYGIVWASWDFYMALPESASLELSPVKDPDSEFVFMTAGPFTDEEEERVRSLPLPFSGPGDLPADLSAGWMGQPRGKSAGNPAIEVAWSYFEGQMEVKQDQNRVRADAESPYALVYDIGGKTLGRIFIDIDADPGTVVDIAFAEDLQNERPWILKRAGIYTATRFITREGRNRLQTFKPYGARFLQVNVSGFESPPVINDFGMYSQVYPFEKTGSFECSDTMLNAIWELGWRTLVVCSEDSYTDTPFRERGLYAGDALPEYAITLATSGDSRLMKYSIFLFSQMYRDLMVPDTDQLHPSVNHMADFPLITLISYAWSVNRTGDLDYAREYYGGYRNMLKLLSSARMENGLLDHGRAFIEWTRIDKNANLTAIQSLAAQAFRSMEYVAGLLGESADSEWFAAEAEKTLDAMHRHCWDDEKGAFRDGFKNGSPIDHHYPVSSIWPSLFGQTTPEQEERLEEFYAVTLADIGDRDRARLSTPYGGFYVLGGLYRQAYTETAENYMKKYWTPMILKHNDTAWENFGDGSEGGGQGTLSHAWSGGPTYHMTAHILGVDLGFPHFSSTDSIILKPQASSVTWARGTVPHPAGTIHVDWKTVGNKLEYCCDMPDGVAWSVEPAGELAGKELWVNGTKVER